MLLVDGSVVGFLFRRFFFFGRSFGEPSFVTVTSISGALNVGLGPPSSGAVCGARLVVNPVLEAASVTFSLTLSGSLSFTRGPIK